MGTDGVTLWVQSGISKYKIKEPDVAAVERSQARAVCCKTALCLYKITLSGSSPSDNNTAVCFRVFCLTCFAVILLVNT